MPSQKKMKNARQSGDYDEIWQSTGKCVFCDLKKKYILLEENGIYLTINLYPYIDGQLLAVPKEHISSPKELSQEQWNTIRKFAYIAKKIIRKAHGIKSMWTVIREGGVDAQMSVTDHLHVHFIPFDQKDLCEWNYRELQFTPKENIHLYRKKTKYILKKYQQFEKKYDHSSRLPAACDAIIINDRNQVLFQVRSEGNQFARNYYTLPGGHIQNPHSSLEKELQREVLEEIDYKLDPDKLVLLDSRLNSFDIIRPVNLLNQERNYTNTIVWNTYLLTNFDPNAQLKPQDDCREIVWIPLEKISSHQRISPDLRKTFKNNLDRIKSLLSSN